VVSICSRKGLRLNSFPSSDERELSASNPAQKNSQYGSKGKAIPIQAWTWLQEVEASGISRQTAGEGGKVASPTHRSPLPPGEIPVLFISLRGWVGPRAIVRPEGLCLTIWRNGFHPGSVCGICGGRSGTEKISVRVLRFFPIHAHSHCVPLITHTRSLNNDVVAWKLWKLPLNKNYLDEVDTVLLKEKQLKDIL
jgi:hypothetical protein